MPANKPTTKHIEKPINIHNQGIKKSVFNSNEIKLPIKRSWM